jgi:hypothetical protein
MTFQESRTSAATQLIRAECECSSSRSGRRSLSDPVRPRRTKATAMGEQKSKASGYFTFNKP